MWTLLRSWFHPYLDITHLKVLPDNIMDEYKVKLLVLAVICYQG